MKHRAMTIGAVASLLFVAVLVVLWVRSFAGRGDQISFATANGWEITLISFRGGFTYYRNLLHPNTMQLGSMIAVRYAFLVLIGLILPALKWGPGHPQLRTGFCPTCGYDLRATPARCPECGVEPAAAREVPVVLLVSSRLWLVAAFGLICFAVGWVGHAVIPDIADDAWLFAVVSGVAFAVWIVTAAVHRTRA